MNISDIITKCYILALIIRDDGERLLLGDGFYEFKEQLQHFQPNIFQNDVIELQGTDGQLLAGQVRRGATQSFDGYIADSTISREATEEHRQRFLAFFRKKHHYKVVYVFPDGSAIKRERGYIVDAPSVPEMFQRFPEFHVGLNFEDVNYYEYDEGEDGEEIFAHVQNIAIAGYVEGGLVWDNYGAVSNEITWVDYALKTTTDGYAQITDGVLGAPLNLTQLFGNTTQIAYTGKNLWGGFPADKSRSMYSMNFATRADGTINVGAGTVNGGTAMSLYPADAIAADMVMTIPAGTYTISGGTDTIFVAIVSSAGSQLYITTASNHERTFTLNDTTQCFLRVQIENGTTVAATTICPMLVAGSSAGSYEPYTGSTPTRLQPSPNPDYPQTVNTVTGEQTVQIVGKNLLTLDGKEWGSPTLDITEVSSNSVTLVPNASSAAYANKNVIYKLKDIGLKTGDTITISADITGTYATDANKPRIRIYGKDSSSVLAVALSPSDNIRTLTIPDDTDQIMFYFYVRDGQTPASGSYATFSNIQLELGSTATAFEPYRAQSQIINLGGTNLWNKDALVTGYLNSSGTVTVGTGTDRTTDYFIEVKPNTAYTLTSDMSGSYGYLKIGEYDSSKTFIQLDTATATLKTYTITTQSTTRYIKASAFVGSGDLPNIMLNEGSTAIPFAPWTSYAYELAGVGEIQPDGLPKYRDYIWNDGGTWKIHKAIDKVIYDGSESWKVSGTGTFNFFYFAANKLSNYVGGNNAITNLATLTEIYSSTTGEGCQVLADGQVRVRYNPELSASDWRAKLATTNMVLYYALATPTDTKITDQTLIQELSTILSLVGETDNIWLIPSAGAQGEMEVRYSRGFINQGAGYVWDAAQGGGPNVVSVDGIDRTGFVWEVVGPATNPTLTNITTNQTMEFEGDVAAGQTLIVNTSDQTATIEGTNVFAQMEGDWMQLAPGNNIITYTATGATEPSKIKWNGVVG